MGPPFLRGTPLQGEEGNCSPKWGSRAWERGLGTAPAILGWERGRRDLKYCFYKLGKSSDVMGLRFPPKRILKGRLPWNAGTLIFPCGGGSEAMRRTVCRRVAGLGLEFSASWFQLQRIPVRDESRMDCSKLPLKGGMPISESHFPAGRGPWVSTPRWTGRNPGPT